MEANNSNSNHSSVAPSSTDAVYAPTLELLGWQIGFDLVKAGAEISLVALCALGLAGNVMILRVAHYMVKTHNKTGYVLLRCNCVVDIVALFFLATFTVLGLLSPVNHHNDAILCKGYFASTRGFFFASTFVNVAISVERFYAVFNPQGHRDKVTVGMMRNLGLATVFYSMTTTFLVALSPYWNNISGHCPDFNQDSDGIIQLIGFVLFSVHFALTPFLVVLVLTAAAGAKLVCSRFSEGSPPVDFPTFKVLLASSIVFVVSNLLTCVYGVLLFYFSENKDDAMNSNVLIFTLVQKLQPILLTIPCVVNFPVFYVISENFRKNLAAARGA